MKGYLATAFAVLMLGTAIGGTVTSWQMDGKIAAAEAETAAVQKSLDDAHGQLAARTAELNDAARSRVMTLSALAGERARAEAADTEATRLRDQIAREVGTDRDGDTAPVLRDTIRKLTHKTASRIGFASDSNTEWRAVVVVRGHVEAVQTVPDMRTCADLALAYALTIKARPEFETQLRGQARIVCSEASARRRV